MSKLRLASCRRLLTTGIAAVVLGVGGVALAPTASAATVSTAYTCYSFLGVYSGTTTLTVTAPATARVNQSVPVSVTAKLNGVLIPLDLTVSSSLDLLVSGSQWGFLRVYGPTIAVYANTPIPDQTLTANLTLTTAGTVNLSAIGSNMTAIWGGNPYSAGCTLQSTPGIGASITVT